MSLLEIPDKYFIWKQADGVMLTPEGQFLCEGYAGAAGYINRPEYEGIKSKGPIVRGWYTIEAPVDSHGGFAMPLTPDPSNDMLGRGHFMIHGALKSEGDPANPKLSDGDLTNGEGYASQGCICIGRLFREIIWKSGVRYLKVVL